MNASRSSSHLLLSSTRSLFARPTAIRRPLSTTTIPPTTPTQDISTPSRLTDALQNLRIQNSFYAKVHVADKAYIVTRGDVIHLPVRLKGTTVGDILTLSNVSAFGSRDYTFSATPPTKRGTKGHGMVGRTEREYLRPGVVRCTAAVLEHTKQPMITTIKKKRRNRHAKAVKRKQPYTVLRIRELELVS